MLQPQIAHHGADHGTLEAAPVMSELGQYVEQLIAVHAAPQLIYHHYPVPVSVERHPELRTHPGNRELEQFWCCRTAPVVDIAAVRRTADGHDFSAQVGEHPGRHLVARTIGAVDDDLESLQIHSRRYGRGTKLLIVRAAAVDAYRLAQMLRFLRHHGHVQ